MALDISRNKNFVKRFSDSKAWVIECKSDGTLVNSTDVWEELPHMAAPKLEAKEETAELKDGSNATIYKSNVLDCYEFTTELLQADKKTLDLIKKARDKFYMLIYKVGTVGGALQYMFFAPGQISSTGGPDYSDFVKIPFTFTSLKNDGVIKIGTAIDATIGIFPADVLTDLATLDTPVSDNIKLQFKIEAEEQMAVIEQPRPQNNTSNG